MAHDPLEVAGRRADHEVVMVIHQAIGVPLGVEPGNRVRKDLNEVPAVVVGPEYSLPASAAIHHVIPGAGELYA